MRQTYRYSNPQNAILKPMGRSASEPVIFTTIHFVLEEFIELLGNVTRLQTDLPVSGAVSTALGLAKHI